MTLDENTIENLVRQRIDTLFSTGENNCAMTVLRVYGEVFETPVDAQVIDAAWCMPGAGGVKHLCGLVGGAVMFVGVWGRAARTASQSAQPHYAHLEWCHTRKIRQPGLPRSAS